MNKPAEQFNTVVAKDISMKQLHGAWQNFNNNDILVDLRSPEDHAKAHIPGSTNISYPTVMEQRDNLQRYKRIFIHCYGGQGSKEIATQLAEQGFNNIHYVGNQGLSDWQSSGYPVEAY